MKSWGATELKVLVTGGKYSAKPWGSASPDLGYRIKFYILFNFKSEQMCIHCCGNCWLSVTPVIKIVNADAFWSISIVYAWRKLGADYSLVRLHHDQGSLFLFCSAWECWLQGQVTSSTLFWEKDVDTHHRSPLYDYLLISCWKGAGGKKELVLSTSE